MRPLLLGVMMLGALGCQTTDVRTNDGRALPPVPSEIPAPPAGISIDAMTLLVGQRPIDVDGDGYPDRIEAAVALFSEDYAAASLRVPGTFVFELVPRGSDPSAIARWTVASDDPKFQTVDALYGPAWQIALDLRLNAWMLNYLVQRVCKAIAESLGFLNRRTKAPYILMKSAICHWKHREKSFGL